MLYNTWNNILHFYAFMLYNTWNNIPCEVKELNNFFL